jgi:aquaporin Z
MAKYLTEAIGTFFLVLTIGLSVLSGFDWAPLAIGSALMVMVYMGGHVSGAHYNPAVSFAVMLRGKLSPRDFAPYLIAQFVGAILASLVVIWIKREPFAIAPGKGVAIAHALLIEVLYTFALALVVLNVATSAKTANNSFYGLAIGFTVAAAAFAAGGISGGAFNPAVGIGVNLVHYVQHGRDALSHTWIYLAGPLIGGALAAGVFRLQEGRS